MNSVIRSTLIVFLAISSLCVQASDLAKEKRWAEQVVDSIIDGDAVWLNDGSHPFLGIYTAAQETSPRAAIVMHGTGVHPNWEQVVQPLRVALTEHGWNTLSIQMPVLGNEADHKEYAPLYEKEVPARINAAIAYLRAQGIKQITLVAHSQGAVMSAYYLRKHSKGVMGFVAIGMSGNLDGQAMNTSLSLKSIHLPVFDLYGSEDLESVLSTNSARAAAAKAAGNKAYTQEMITDANHFFDGKNDELITAVADWLDKLPK